MASHEWSLAQLTAKAEAYCAAAEHCWYEVQQKLQQWEATPEQIEQILCHLQKYKYLDNDRYCHAFVHDKLLYQGWGRIKMRAHLQAKHLPSNSIKQAIEDMDENIYQEVLQKVLSSKKRSLKSSNQHLHEKLIRFCMQRGFTYEEITNLL